MPRALSQGALGRVAKWSFFQSYQKTITVAKVLQAKFGASTQRHIQNLSVDNGNGCSEWYILLLFSFGPIILSKIDD
jgi:hypothetical protein